MNTNTGEIKELHELKDFQIEEKEDFVKILNEDMTKKQTQNKRVSLHDRKSKLGKQLTEIRKSRKLQRSQRKFKK